jgi:hypothetical protein
VSKLEKDNMYYGFGGEHYIISQFYAMYYEATKMSVDFGFDILITNQYRVSKGIDGKLENLALQVKTATVRDQDYIQADDHGEGLINWIRKSFYISKNDFDLICRSENAALVCLFVKKEEDGFKTLGQVWFNGKHLLELEKNNGFKYIETGKYQGCYRVDVRLALSSSLNHLAEFFLDRLKSEGISVDKLSPLSTIINSSEIVRENFESKIDIEILNGNIIGFGPISEQLTKLSGLLQPCNVGAILDEDTYQNRFYKRIDDKIDSLNNVKFEWELSQGYYD